MAKVTLGQFSKKDKAFIINVKAGMLKAGTNYKDLAKKSGTSPKTVYLRYKNPEKMTVRELRAYIKVAKIPQNEVIDFLYENV